MEVVYLEVLGGGRRSKPGPVCRDEHRMIFCKRMEVVNPQLTL
jgi:hypothetical protein